ncbi:response regulator [Fusibacter sp. 3D3]|uniref:response regulator n=1 Tax=Fusibacter sp. 3D3 TaxID=1048380 RepID=UPI0008532FDB|nr:response regulator [Fusibacter sp. 3D3]GAU77231.1 two-component response regulator controling glutamine utilization [Fusibacter sp. 3D3]
MKIYIVDDDISVIKMLEEIILDEVLGELIGSSLSSKKALEEIPILRPDIILLDLLMPEVDGTTLVETLKEQECQSKFIMISQVSSKKIIGEAYERGITFYISKPVNKKEVATVIRNVTDNIMIEQNLDKIKKVLNIDGHNHPSISISNVSGPQDHLEKKIKVIFSRLGILGESGCDEMIKLCKFIKEGKISLTSNKLKDISNEISDNPKAMEQRIRRAINRGLSNIASLGIEDYLNEVFVKYSNTLFDFEQVRLEMEYLRGKKAYGGKINIKKFIDNLILLVDEM